MEGRFRDLQWRMAVITLAVGMPMLAMFTDTACATILALVTASQMACGLLHPLANIDGNDIVYRSPSNLMLGRHVSCDHYDTTRAATTAQGSATWPAVTLSLD